MSGQRQTEGVKAQQLIFIGFKAINLQSLSSYTNTNMITGREKTRAGEWGATWLVPPKCLLFFFSICADSFKRGREGGSHRGCT